MNKFRNELKFLISDEEMYIIKSRLKSVMQIDEHAQDGRYLISSLYFDDYDDSCLYDVFAGVDRREKYRLRFYNGDIGRIALESKFKRNLLVKKRITRLDENEANTLVRGKHLRNIDDELKKEFTYKMMSYGLHPVVIVEYERIPYVYSLGNVRITFDSNLRSSSDVRNYLSGYSHCRPVLEENTQILEVKYDEFLPQVIYDCIDIGNLKQLSISKYSLCRRYKI